MKFLISLKPYSSPQRALRAQRNIKEREKFCIILLLIPLLHSQRPRRSLRWAELLLIDFNKHSRKKHASYTSKEQKSAGNLLSALPCQFITQSLKRPRNHSIIFRWYFITHASFCGNRDMCFLSNPKRHQMLFPHFLNPLLFESLAEMHLSFQNSLKNLLLIV